MIIKTLAMVRRRGLSKDEPQRHHEQAAGGVDAGRAAAVVRGRRKEASLEAGAHVAASDRQGLTHLLRYGTPIAGDRLRMLEDGKVELRLCV
ncbi:MAG: hypothetical protein HY901_24165 [Deltaproteobacteria bacterium]|nr:hypothetical protein [Deltaproteobacteria bacterium]